MKKPLPELLAPAGSFDSLVSAISHGADAVYAGGSKYSARSSAENFTIEKLREATEYCHVRGKKLYLAVNTLILDKEIDGFLEYIDQVVTASPDALIIQDAGMAHRIKQIYPNLPLHASTQMSLHNTYGVEWASDIGFKRVVLARETPLDDIKTICSHGKAETEVFVHGALCISFSGQCLLSSMAGQRSGNRGKCAQPCRLPYSVTSGNTTLDSGYCLSPKDLCTLPYLGELVDAGITSLKIEGRLKRPEYVASVVSQYRTALDALADGENFDVAYAEKEMAKIFNRGGFTRGYYQFSGLQDAKLPLSPNQAASVIFSKKPNHCGILCGKIVFVGNGRVEVAFSENVPKASDISIGSEVIRTSCDYSQGSKASFKLSANKAEDVYLLNDSISLAKWAKNGTHGTVKLAAEVTVKKNILPSLTVSDGVHSVTVLGDDIAEEAQGKGTPEQDLISKLMKTGNTPFEFERITVDTDNSFLRVSSINALRRKALDAIYAERLSANSKLYTKAQSPTAHTPSTSAAAPEIAVEVRTVSMLSALAPYANKLYYSPLTYSCETLDQALKVCPANKLYLVLPPVMTERDFEFLDSELSEYFPLLGGAVVCNAGQAFYARKRFKTVVGDYQLNIINKESLMLYSQICDRITVSSEATLSQARDICDVQPCELAVYGRIALMNLTHCHLKEKGHCGTCRATLTDRGGRVFPMERYGIQTCCMRVLNCDKLSMSGHKHELARVNAAAYRFIFTDETPEQALNALHEFENGIAPSGRGYTTGHYYRGLNDE